MIHERLITEQDREKLAKEIAADETHPNTPTDFYYEPETMSVAFEDDEGIVAFVRYSSALRIHTQFCSDASKRRIMEFMASQFPAVAARAKSNKYKEIVFASVSQRLKAFCKRYLKFQPSPDEHVHRF